MASILLGLGAGACGEVMADSESHKKVQTEDCIACHQAEYAAATTPPHAGVMPTTCGSCHTQTAWSPAKFAHTWPLVGAHAKTGCQKCHLGEPPVYAGTPQACVGCHQPSYDYAVGKHPEHQAFPKTCETCHNQIAWLPASPVEHPFPLLGAHASAPCTGCHVGGVYKGTPKDCWSCHQSDFQASPYPGHQGFSHVCSDCHTTVAWKPATGGHPEAKFPIAIGKHSGIACNDCHDPKLGPTSKSNVSCTGCHTGAHADAKMDEVHADEPDYPQNTTSVSFCLDCHPTGMKD